MRLPALPLYPLLVLLGALPALAEAPPAVPPERARVHHVRITVLSTMLAEKQGVGEWGFAALVEADGRRLLFDTGARPRTVLENAKALGVDLSTVTDVVLSHFHGDHTGGLVTLRQELKKQHPAALSRVHGGRGLFWSRPRTKGGEGNPMLGVRARYEASGGRFIEHAGPVELVPGVWLTGPVPRVHPERNWSGQGRVRAPEGLVEDTVPEDQSLIVDSTGGLVVLTGCGHAGIINILEAARARVRSAPVAAVVGGLHLFTADENTLAWTGGKLREFQVGALLGGHCTGIEAVGRLRELAGLTRETCVVSAVGSSFESGRGLDPLDLAR